VKAFTAALPRTAASRQQQLLSLQLRATAEDEILDISESINLSGPSSAVQTPADDTEYSLDELTAAAMETHINSLAVADIEADFTAGANDEELTGYLTSLQQEAEALLVDGKGPAAEAAAASLEAAAAEMLEAGDVPEAEVKEDLGVLPLNATERDVLEGLSNEEAVTARQVVSALKLSKQELEEHILPADWDATTTDWFTNKEEDDIPLPEYKLVFLWFDKNIAVAVDQVYARGNGSCLTEYFIWPRKDAWEELKVALEQRPWISDIDKIRLLNRLTEVINFWMGTDGQVGPDGVPLNRRTIDEAREAFPDCTFAGAL
jgi:30S ribosomal protein 3